MLLLLVFLMQYIATISVLYWAIIVDQHFCGVTSWKCFLWLWRQVEILCNEELLGKDHTLKFITMTRWRNKVSSTVITEISLCVCLSLACSLSLCLSAFMFQGIFLCKRNKKTRPWEKTGFYCDQCQCSAKFCQCQLKLSVYPSFCDFSLSFLKAEFIYKEVSCYMVFTSYWAKWTLHSLLIILLVILNSATFASDSELGIHHWSFCLWTLTLFLLNTVQLILNSAFSATVLLTISMSSFTVSSLHICV